MLKYTVALSKDEDDVRRVVTVVAAYDNRKHAYLYRITNSQGKATHSGIVPAATVGGNACLLLSGILAVAYAMKLPEKSSH